jgi:hypothetical protein
MIDMSIAGPMQSTAGTRIKWKETRGKGFKVKVWSFVTREEKAKQEKKTSRLAITNS